MSLRNTGEGRWYWKFRDQHGLFHYYDPIAFLDRRPLCNLPYVKEVSRPGSYGKETVVTCIACIGKQVPMDKAADGLREATDGRIPNPETAAR